MLVDLIHLPHLRSILQAVCEEVERPAGFSFSEKMRPLDLFDMHFFISATF
jgi:hypothetical protein